MFEVPIESSVEPRKLLGPHLILGGLELHHVAHLGSKWPVAAPSDAMSKIRHRGEDEVTHGKVDCEVRLASDSLVNRAFSLMACSSQEMENTMSSTWILIPVRSLTKFLVIL